MNLFMLSFLCVLGLVFNSKTETGGEKEWSQLDGSETAEERMDVTDVDWETAKNISWTGNEYTSEPENVYFDQNQESIGVDKSALEDNRTIRDETLRKQDNSTRNVSSPNELNLTVSSSEFEAVNDTQGMSNGANSTSDYLPLNLNKVNGVTDNATDLEYIQIPNNELKSNSTELFRLKSYVTDIPENYSVSLGTTHSQESNLELPLSVVEENDEVLSIESLNNGPIASSNISLTKVADVNDSETHAGFDSDTEILFSDTLNTSSPIPADNLIKVGYLKVGDNDISSRNSSLELDSLVSLNNNTREYVNSSVSNNQTAVDVKLTSNNSTLNFDTVLGAVKLTLKFPINRETNRDGTLEIEKTLNKLNVKKGLEGSLDNSEYDYEEYSDDDEIDELEDFDEIMTILEFIDKSILPKLFWV